CATGVMIGSGIGGLQTIYEASVQVHEGKARRLSPFFIPSALINLISGQVSIRYGLKGPNHSAVTACATGVHAIGDAARLVGLGDADVMLAGGAEAAVCPLGIAGFSASRALSTNFNDTPEAASRPWDKDRDGFVMGEGAGVVILEEYEHARRRGAKIYAEFAGYGMSGDAHHITAPAEHHEGAYRAMRAALKSGGIQSSDIQYVNAHGTSTPMGDDLELEAVEKLFGDAGRNVAMSSTKSATGHLLGAAGAVEAIFSILAVRDGVVPPTLNLDEPSRFSVIDRVPHTAQERKVDVVLSNSFGFGGTNASILFRAT
ncbi:MAG TPA: beta-ketoacyl-ACP synthase II, partial [Acetobacteraceae bacterium]|nr:beta-ketoacyl-ACP synthase II [Acetobacteraceae bacterium]